MAVLRKDRLAVQRETDGWITARTRLETPNRRTGIRIPQANEFILSTRGQESAIRREGSGGDLGRRVAAGPNSLACGDLPEMDIFIARRQHLTIRRKSQTRRAARLFQLADFFAVVHLPQSDLIEMARGEKLAIRRKSQQTQIPRTTQRQCSHLLTRRGIPEDNLVVAVGGDSFAVGRKRDGLGYGVLLRRLQTPDQSAGSTVPNADGVIDVSSGHEFAVRRKGDGLRKADGPARRR